MKRVLGAGLRDHRHGCRASRQRAAAATTSRPSTSPTKATRTKATNIDGAISKYEQATNLDPTNHRSSEARARVPEERGRGTRSRPRARRPRSSRRSTRTTTSSTAYALARQAVKGPTGWADAKPPLEEAIKLDPNLADAHFELAEVLLHLDDEEARSQCTRRRSRRSPTTLAFYGPLAELYIRLNYIDQAEQVLTQGSRSRRKATRRSSRSTASSATSTIARTTCKAVSEYEAAKKACGQCNEAGQQIAFFNLGAAYASLKPAAQERGDGAAPVLPEDDLQGRRRAALRRPVHAGAAARDEARRHAPVSASAARSASRTYRPTLRARCSHVVEPSVALTRGQAAFRAQLHALESGRSRSAST